MNWLTIHLTALKAVQGAAAKSSVENWSGNYATGTNAGDLIHLPAGCSTWRSTRPLPSAGLA
jgi:hypothetical protein